MGDSQNIIKRFIDMIEVEFYAGENIESAMSMLYKEADKTHQVCCGKFNCETLLSTDSIDDAYKKVTGKTKAEHDEYERKWREEYERREAEHKAKIPALTEEYKQKARGLVLDSELEYWDKIVPIRLGDLYHGMELGQTLDICAIMRDEKLTYDERLHKAYKLFIDSGHSGCSANLTANMIKRFCPDGADVADAVLNFRFDKED